MEFFNRFPPLVKVVFDAIKKTGGRVYIVGGYVRDELLKLKENKDVDVEVYGMEPQHLQVLLAKFGETKQIGRTFGVFKLMALPQFDFALARLEKKSGQLHQDFTINYQASLSFEEAAKRRDLTINSILFDPYTNEYIDPYNGINDLHTKTLSLVDEKTFQEDPLRVLRVARMLAKLPDFTVDERTKRVCQMMVKDLVYLSKERIFSEYSKLLLSVQPSFGLQFLLDIGALLPEITVMATTNQRLDFHPEGSVFNHTLLVVDIAAICKDKATYPLGFMWAALLHDIGKPTVTTSLGKAPNHDLVGEPIAQNLMFSLSNNKHLARYVALMVRCHMVLMSASRNTQKPKTYLKVLKRLDNVVGLDDLALLCKCDKMGRARIDCQSIENFDAYINKMKETYGMIAMPPLLNGQDFINLGYSPNSQFKKMLEDAYEQQLDGKNQKQIIQYILSKYER